MLKSDFYSIYRNSDGTCDCYLTPEKGGKVYIARRIPGREEKLEEDLRRHYEGYLHDAKEEERWQISSSEL